MLGSLMPKQARIPGYDTGILVPELMVVRSRGKVHPAQGFPISLLQVDYSEMGNVPWD